ncbi:PQQ-binding-like beta-propeller repeat protein [Thaumasiovibrio subtropicus]|uniref:outer membrane protein assembly factor BamB family protein n=1 Tax=Thaumasiovibrio subtropicus TaxID=1891207 RepID=UPI000B35B8BC|nr:PQQ-binding-like beta-propeller repeat protein [Thaumasiovibrio subtropicus]
MARYVLFLLLGVLVGCGEPESLQDVAGLYYHNGSLYTGDMVKKDEDGQVRETASFVEGKKTGWHRKWHPNGQLAYEQEFDDGSASHIALFWDEDGAPTTGVSWEKSFSGETTFIQLSIDEKMPVRLHSTRESRMISLLDGHDHLSRSEKDILMWGYVGYDYRYYISVDADSTATLYQADDMAKVWQKQISIHAEAQYVIADTDQLALVTQDQRIVIFRKQDGEKIASLPLAAEGELPVLKGLFGQILLAEFENALHAIDVTSGKVLWSQAALLGFKVLHHDSLYIAYSSDLATGLTAIDPKTGNVIWFIDPEPVKGGYEILRYLDTLILANRKQLFGFDFETGQALWQHKGMHQYGIVDVFEGVVPHHRHVAILEAKQHAYFYSEIDHRTGEITYSKKIRQYCPRFSRYESTLLCLDSEVDRDGNKMMTLTGFQLKRGILDWQVSLPVQYGEIDFYPMNDTAILIDSTGPNDWYEKNHLYAIPIPVWEDFHKREDGEDRAVSEADYR